MPDGKRARRNSPLAAKRRWYALHRCVRFNRRFGLATASAPAQAMPEREPAA